VITFVTCVKHPENSQSYDKVWQLLNNSLFSVCSQQDTDFRVIVVCDKELPLLHHQELIYKFTEFVQVDFPCHGEEVLNNFNQLGNLSPPLDDPRWKEIQNDFQTSIEFFGRSGPSLLLQLLDRLVGHEGIDKLREFKSRIRMIVEGEKKHKQKIMQDYFHIANVVLNMGTKLLIGILAAKKYNPEYVMFFDADDYIGNDISAYVNAHPGENGWIMSHGYRMAEKRIVPYYRWNSICGTGNIYNYSLLLQMVGSEVSEKSTQNELFKHIDSEFLITIGRHNRPRKFFYERGYPFLDYPARSVIHLVDHDESSEFKRKLIHGKPADVFLRNAQKFGEIAPVSSTQIAYFNILPVNSTRVFCLGFQKTGTTSVDWVLQDMGYQVSKAYKQPDIAFSQMLQKGDLSEIRHVAKLFDAFQDIPWFLYYKEFDKWYPGSKFILTIRESTSWWNSFLRYFRTEYYSLFEYVYGFENPIGHKEALIKRFEQHNREVLEYFKDRPDDLLVVDVSEEKALEKITNFLGRSSSYEKMPHKNATLSVPENEVGGRLKRNLKRLRKIRAASFIKLITFSAPPIIIAGSRKSGVEQLLSILSCHPNIHAVGTIKLNHLTHHPLSPEADRKKERILAEGDDLSGAIDQKKLVFNLLSKPISLSAKRWAGACPLGILAYARILNQFGKNIRIINVVRDGRDVVVESTKKVMAKYVVDPEQWVHDIKAGVEFESHPQILTVRYEDLVQDYEKIIREICTFIGESNPAPFLSYPKGATIIEDGYWIGKWKQAQYSERTGHLLAIPDATIYLRYYGYID
jgi:Sulfotransferase domain/Sulfotransferase family